MNLEQCVDPTVTAEWEPQFGTRDSGSAPRLEIEISLKFVGRLKLSGFSYCRVLGAIILSNVEIQDVP